jgi:hypothetical protein
MRSLNVTPQLREFREAAAYTALRLCESISGRLSMYAVESPIFGARRTVQEEVTGARHEHLLVADV